MKKKYLHGNITAPLFMLFIGALVVFTDRLEERGAGTVVLQFVVYLLPAVLFIRIKGEGYAGKLRLRLFSPRVLAFCLFTAAAAVTGAALLRCVLYRAGVEGALESLYVRHAAFEGLKLTDGPIIFHNLHVIMILVILPAILEEIVFRGIITAEYEKGGQMTAVILSAFYGAFLSYGSLAFYSAEKTATEFLVLLLFGVLLGIAAVITDSLAACALIHTLYALANIYGADIFRRMTARSQNMTVVIFLLGVLFLTSLIFLLSGMANVFYRKAYSNAPSPVSDKFRAVHIAKNFMRAVLSPTFILFAIALGVYLFVVSR